MDDAERIALKAACIQAAAMLLAPQPQPQPQPQPPPQPPAFGARSASPSPSPSATAAAEPDTAACARYARDLYAKLTNEPWD